MNEQEKREKAIEEILEQINPWCTFLAKGCNRCSLEGLICNDYKVALRIYDAGYRKEEEVQKETAKDIYCELYKISFKDENGMMHPTFENWVNTLKKFGVEVEQ